MKESILNPEYRQKLRRKFLKNRYEPLYGLLILHLLLKNDGYKMVSFAENSIPTAGSQTYSIEKCNPIFHFEIDKVIIHKDLNVTIKTKEKGYCKYLK